MKEVTITFSNLQSHESSRFTLKPGINFILAEDNNVGKSAIFKVLSTIAKAPKVNGAKLDRLIRTGTSKAYAAFDMEGERVVAWFIRGDTPGGTKLFFEHLDSTGEVVRYASCPQFLLDALGIVRNEDGDDVINFNDADSVQLIARQTAEADSLVTQVLQDQRIETIKQTYLRLHQTLVGDDRVYSAQVDTASKMLSDMTFNTSVVSFNDMLPKLEAMCRVCDSGLKPMPKLVEGTSVNQEQFDLCGILLRAISSVTIAHDELTKVEKSVTFNHEAMLKWEQVRLDRLYRVISLLGSAEIDKLLRTKARPKRYRSRYLDHLYFSSIAVTKALSFMKESNDARREVKLLQVKNAELGAQMLQRSKIVDCPVRGKVFYSNDKCIPCSDGSPL